jgi:hypothetical protein
MMVFNTSTSHFQKKIILIFRGLFNVETDPKVKVKSKD